MKSLLANIFASGVTWRRFALGTKTRGMVAVILAFLLGTGVVGGGGRDQEQGWEDHHWAGAFVIEEAPRWWRDYTAGVRGSAEVGSGVQVVGSGHDKQGNEAEQDAYQRGYQQGQQSR